MERRPDVALRDVGRGAGGSGRPSRATVVDDDVPSVDLRVVEDETVCLGWVRAVRAAVTIRRRKERSTMRKIVFTVCIGAVAATAMSVPVQADGGSCWGAASAAFAQLGEMGEHSATQPTPRIGLRNLARSLYEAGVIPDDSMDALGTFVAETLDLSLEACI